MLNKKLIELAQKIKNNVKPNITISTAESCTGGMVSAYLTYIPGSSEYFAGGIVSYSNNVKMRLLSVKKDTLEKFGAVSEETAGEMATGCKNITRSDIAVSITGIAGPGGGTENKPVGTVCFAIATTAGVETITRHFNGTRAEIRESSCLVALELILGNI
jgi:PncC family amidohydrolase